MSVMTEGLMEENVETVNEAVEAANEAVEAANEAVEAANEANTVDDLENDPNALLSFLQGDDELSEEDKALLDEYSDEDEDELDFNASDTNEALTEKFAPLKPKVEIVDGKKQVTLPLGYLSAVTVYENKKEDSNGYFINQKRTKLRFEFTGLKDKKGDAVEKFTTTLDPIADDLADKAKQFLFKKQLETINDLARVYGVAKLFRNVDAKSKILAVKELNRLKAEGEEPDQSTFVMLRYKHTFTLWAAIFNYGRKGKPVYIQTNKSETETDAAGNPINIVPLRIHITVYNNRWTTSLSPFVEVYKKGVKPSVVPDPIYYKYEKTENAANDGEGAVNVPSGSSDIIAEDVEFDEVEFE